MFKLKIYGLRAVVGLLLTSSVLLSLTCKKGDVIEEIGGYAITTKDYEEYYGAYLEKASRIVNVEKKTLYQYVCNPPDSRANPMLADLVQGLNPPHNYRKYRDMRIIEQVARQSGFTDRPVVRQILDQVILETVAQLYLQEKMDERTKVSLEQKQQKCNELRKEFPDRMGPLPIERCLDYAGALLKREQQDKLYPEFVQEVKESVVIRRNNSFNKDDFLEKRVELYNTMRKEGGCYSESTTVTPSKDEDKKPEGKDKEK